MGSELNLTETQRVCVICREVLHIDKFSIGRDGYRSETCNRCEPEYQALRLEEKRRLTLEEVVRKLGSTKQIKVSHTSELAAQIEKEIGGIEEFAKLFALNMTSACTAEPGSKTALEYQKSFIALITKSTEQRETAPDVPLLSDEQLTDELNARVMDLLSANPQLVSQWIEQNTKPVENLSEQNTNE